MESAIIVLMGAMLSSYLNKSLKEDYKEKETYTIEEINKSMMKASMSIIKDMESKKQEDELSSIKLPNDLLN